MRLTAAIEHVVILVKENHGFDNYFASFPGADGQAGLPRSRNPPPRDPNHTHAAWLQRGRTSVRAAFVEADIPAYWDWARRYTLCDRHFTDVAGPSTPNHLMLVAGRSPIVDNPRGTPSYDLPTLAASLDHASLTWRNYNGYVFDYIPYTAGQKLPGAQFAADAAAGKLATVSWVYADHPLSEHPPDTPGDRAAGVGNVTVGMRWTAQQVAAVVAGGLWPKVAIFVTWDDWGGWYDHVDPPEVSKWTDGTQFRYGGRVPCLVLSPYARPGYVSKVLHSHVSLLRFCEVAFGLPATSPLTAAADGMEDCFDFTQSPQPPP